MKKLSPTLILLVFLCASCAQFAAPPALIPRAVLFGNPEKKDPQISPDGKYVSYLAPDQHNVLQIWLRSLNGNDDRQITREEKRGIQHYTWAYDSEHVIFAREQDGDENWQIQVANIVTRAGRNLTPYNGVRSLLVGMSPHDAENLLVAMNLRNRRFYDVYRIHLKTGDTRMVNRNGGAQSWWVADGQLNVRVAAAFAGTIVRDRPGRPWRVARKWHPAEFGRYIGLSADGQRFFMGGSHNGEFGALLAIDLSNGSETVIASDPKYDVEDALVHPVSREVQAVGFYKDKLEWRVVDQAVADDFRRLLEFQPGEMTLLHPPYESPIVYSNSLGRRDLPDRHWIVTYENDAGPRQHYLYRRDTKSLSLLFTERPELESFRLAPMKPVVFKSRDGLDVHGYLTLPVGSTGKNLPTVLYVHGGPQSRDRWGFHDAIQWLANRGYAVLQINYRGSTGYGRRFVLAGDKEWGGKMHDDLIDGVNWLVAEDIADAKKIAIMGASYGGYATLVGLTLTPGVFVAGVSNVGISNLISHHDNYPPYWPKIRFRTRVGDPQKEADMLRSRSPLFHVDNIIAPLLLAHGANDVRVKAKESEQMAAAMRQVDKQVDYRLYPDEGHRQWRPENKIHFYATAEEFLAKHLGGRFEPAGEISGHSAIAK